MWSVGSHEYVLSGRESLFRGDYFEDLDRSALLIGERIGLDGTRNLEMTIEVAFSRSGLLTISGGIIVSTEVSEGFDEDEILILPKRTTRSVTVFTDILAQYAKELCANPGILEGLAVRK